jgi:hypothetical protein
VARRKRGLLRHVWLLRSRPLALALGGAACGYLTLFGPLVLIPQVLNHGLGSAARTGLLLSALPLGFGLAALFGDLLLPSAWGDRRRGFTGAVLACAVMCAAIVVPVTQATVVPLLALAGLGLGIFVPANNTVIMRSTADSSASLVGGLVSMARGIGTTFGISLMALALHLGTQGSQAGNPGYAAHHGYPWGRAGAARVHRARRRRRDGCRDRAGRPRARADGKRAGRRAGRASQGGGPVRCRSLRT